MLQGGSGGLKEEEDLGEMSSQNQVCETRWVSWCMPQDFSVLDMGFPMWMMSLGLYIVSSVVCLSFDDCIDSLSYNKIVYNLLTSKLTCVTKVIFDSSLINKLNSNCCFLISSSFKNCVKLLQGHKILASS